MDIFNNILEVRETVTKWKEEGLTIGLVPTMGFLHEGHKSLIENAKKSNDKVVVSIFVNPIQFGVNEDLESYPRDLDKDSKLCSELGVDIIFNPSSQEMYFDDFSTYVNMGGLTEGLCGKSRPNHFRGVCTVVLKLFNIVNPTRAYFGEKDAQQLAVIKRMVRDLNCNIEIVPCPIIREEDGVAKSSRNTYLSSDERQQATILSQSLLLAKEAIKKGENNAKEIKRLIINNINKCTISKIDYVEIVDSLSLMEVEKIEKSVLIALAVYIGKTRLIDNISLEI